MKNKKNQYEIGKRWLPEPLSTEIYRCLGEIYPYERRILGMCPVKVIEMEGMYVIQLRDEGGCMLDISILTHQLIAQNMTREPLAHEFFGLMRKALDTQDRLRNGEQKEKNTRPRRKFAWIKVADIKDL